MNQLRGTASSAIKRENDTIANSNSVTTDSIDDDPSNLHLLLGNLGHNDNQDAMLHPSRNASIVNNNIRVGSPSIPRRQRHMTIKDADSTLRRHEGSDEGLVSGPVDDASDAQARPLRIPVEADVGLVGAGEGDVNGKGRGIAEDVDGRSEG